jgi:hypothetical protein
MLKILIVADITYRPEKLYLYKEIILAKGFNRLGHDVRTVSYCGLMSELSPFKNRHLLRLLYKKKADEAVYRYSKQYKPDIILFGFARYLDSSTILMLREGNPSAIFMVMDGDLYPNANPSRIDIGREMDFVLATNNGKYIDEYRKSGSIRCAFIPNVCNPDVEFRYPVSQRWESGILWTGKVQHKKQEDNDETIRQEILLSLINENRAKLYGCFDLPKIAGLDYFYAISGAKIGLSINVENSIPLYHSDRFTHYAACGSMVLAKRVPETELLMEDKKHVVYFDTKEECFELMNWYLKHENERTKIASFGMERCRKIFCPEKIGEYIFSLINSGQYSAPWGTYELK